MASDAANVKRAFETGVKVQCHVIRPRANPYLGMGCCASYPQTEVGLPKGIGFSLSKEPIDETTKEVGCYTIPSKAIDVGNGVFLNLSLCQAPEDDTFSYISTSNNEEVYRYYDNKVTQNDGLASDNVISAYIGGLRRSITYDYSWMIKELQEELANYFKGKYVVFIFSKDNDVDNKWMNDFLNPLEKELLYEESFCNRNYNRNENYLTVKVYKF